MKTKPSLRRSICGLFMLLALFALPSSSALAAGYCSNVNIYYNYDAGPTGIRVLMYSPFPSGVTIFYTNDGTYPGYDPITWAPNTGTLIYYGYIPVPSGQCRTYTAKAAKPGYGDSGYTSLQVCNTPE